MIEKLFGSVAQQVDWDACTRAFLAQLFSTQGLKLPDGEITMAAVAGLNNYAETLFRRDVSNWLDRAILHDYAMSREYRFAMLQLCLSQLDPTNAPELGQAIKEWLRGELRLITTVKRAGIFQRIADRTDATIHHVGRRDNVGAGLRVRQGLFDQHGNGFVVQHVAAGIDQAILAMRGKRIQRDIGDDTKLREFLFQQAHGALRETFRVIRFAGIVTLQCRRRHRK